MSMREKGGERERERERGASTALPINHLSLPPNLIVSVWHHGISLFIRAYENISVVLVGAQGSSLRGNF